MSQQAPKYPAFRPAAFSPLNADSLRYTDVNATNTDAVAADRAFYDRADTDYNARHPDLVAANRANEARINSEINGGLPPGFAADLTRAGLGGALNSFGTGSAVAPGSTGAFGVARNLGVDYGAYENSLSNQLAQLNAATPERTFGLGGQGILALNSANDALRNQVAIGNFQGQNQVAIANTGNANAAAQGGFAAALNANNAANAQTSGLINSGISLAGQVAGSRGGQSALSGFGDWLSGLGSTGATGG